MLSLLLALTIAAPPSERLTYERKCLYCHSEEVAERKRLTVPQWRRVIDQMRKKAPLLISRSDAALITRYVTQTLRLTVATPARHAVTPAPEVKTGPSPQKLTEEPESEAAETPAPAIEPELEQQASALIQHRCSKCHALGRVYGRLDTLERSLTTLERMRLKTGSGITDDDVRVIEAYLRAQF